MDLQRYTQSLRVPQRFVEMTQAIQQPQNDTSQADKPNGRQQYTNSFNLVNENGYSLYANCAEIFFLNLGTSVVTINNVLPLTTGQFIGLDGQFCEEDVTHYNINFDNTGTNKLLIIRKIYV